MAFISNSGSGVRSHQCLFQIYSWRFLESQPTVPRTCGIGVSWQISASPVFFCQNQGQKSCLTSWHRGVRGAYPIVPMYVLDFRTDVCKDLCLYTRESTHRIHQSRNESSLTYMFEPWMCGLLMRKGFSIQFLWN